MEINMLSVKNIDIIIPVYNGEGFILRAIRSVLSQTCKPSNIIVVDDCSTDNTIGIVEEFSQNSIVPITIVKNKENFGPSLSRNIGLGHSRSDFLIFLDADDELYSNMIERILPDFFSDGENSTGLVYCRRDYFDEVSSKVIDSMSERNANLNKIKNNTALSRLLEDIDCIAMGCFIIKREAIISVGKFDSTLRICEDWDLYLRMADMGYRFICHDEVLCKIYSHNNNTTKSSQYFYGIVLFINKWMGIIEACPIKRRYFKDIILSSIVEDRSGIGRYFWLLKTMPRKNIRIIFGNFSFSLELKIIKKLLVSIINKIRTLSFIALSYFVKTYFSISIKDGYKEGLYLVENGLFLKSFFVMKNDKTISKYYKEHGYWELPMSLYLRRISKKSLNLIDVGANIGYFSALFAKYIKSGGNICSVEANPYLINTLKDNVKSTIDLSQKSVRHIVINKIASNCDGENKKFYRFSELVGNSSIFRPNTEEVIAAGENYAEESVGSIDLDSIQRELKLEKIDIIRIDAEGSEAEILQGARNIISSNPNIVIICEYLSHLYINSDYSSTKLLSELRTLSDLGFRIFSINSVGFLRQISIEFLEKGYSGDIVIKR